MRQRAARNIIDAELCQPGDVLFRDVAGAFRLRPAPGQPDRFRHIFGGHIVQHDDIRARVQRFFQLIEGFHFDFDFPDKGRIGLGRLHRRRHAARRADVIVFEQHAVGQVVAMIVPAAHAHGILLKHPHIRGGLSRIQQFRLCPFQQFRHRPRIRRNPAHALQIIERHPLARKEHPDIPRHFGEQLSLFHFVPVAHKKLRLRRRIQQFKRARKHVQPADHAVLLAQKLHLPLAILRHHGVGGNVLARDVLPKRHFDQPVRLQFFRNRIHTLFFSLFVLFVLFSPSCGNHSAAGFRSSAARCPAGPDCIPASFCPFPPASACFSRAAFERFISSFTRFPYSSARARSSR